MYYVMRVDFPHVHELSLPLVAHIQRNSIELNSRIFVVMLHCIYCGI